jgi:flagellar biosynthesis protein
MYSRHMLFKKDGQYVNTQATDPLTTPERSQAIALGYDALNDQAPKVLASGKGYVAEQIIALAKANGIPIREDPILATALANVAIDTQSPPELYAVIAEVLAYVYHIRQQQFP